ncbi:tRNA (adenosine(37)-N6)-threonylcarbamoyltransferase complex dimerization subunit type 1 TsaB [Cognatiyoonia sp. IB215182]|uniref:tRNA (adenosine(37)-N6)-threonylcarbamoyltransferase complex dimerization subunit type 1 TsaB n=1 Tax=Cognatiyoonia sp. IB215182 TaxID=3097353 RepID=UPI002A0AE90D|nr:tRNA (adenosine(37)-N6)-threonylcarbamoyltransferase complex dimerization subunit type 1 TsaB [Cognatiyoonia sp. IB215182]MDX8351737.1 tRNA (adenosine(37)-N6)-threonylcarbamoyltransferase complex dimerization subunit type 1 TsaB [Cognatiyoonia sp. IB215182]
MLYPKLIAFDTSAAHCAAALLLQGQVITRVDEMARGQAEHLMPMLQQMLQAAGLDWSDLDAVAVGTGPGNFTGIRISVSAARGLGLGLGRPVIGVTGFEMRAFDEPRPFTATIRAPREASYIQTFHADGSTTAPVQQDVPAGPQKPAADLIAAAAHIAAARIGEKLPRPAPLYIRPADAAPPKDTAPVILS